MGSAATADCARVTARSWLAVAAVALGASLAAGTLAAPAAGAAFTKDRRCAPAGNGELTVIKPSRHYVASVGTMQVAMIFVDFRDAKATQTTQELADLYSFQVPEWFREVSYGKLDVEFRAGDRWLRMPHKYKTMMPHGPSSTNAHYEAFIRAAIKAADPVFDFSGIDATAIIAPKGGDLGAASDYPAVKVDGTTIRNHITVREDKFDHPPELAWHGRVMSHELGHTMKLPDYYSYEDAFDLHKYVGSWDSMGDAYLGNHFSAWTKRALGWLSKRDSICLRRGSATFTLNAVDDVSGKRSAYIRTGRKKAYVVETRRRAGFDLNICRSGVVIYRLNAARLATEGGIRVVPRNRDSGRVPRRCLDNGGSGRHHKAPFRPGHVFRDRRKGVKVKVLGVAGSGYKVRVKRD